jgi:hypothetical protein
MEEGTGKRMREGREEEMRTGEGMIRVRVESVRKGKKRRMNPSAIDSKKWKIFFANSTPSGQYPFAGTIGPSSFFSCTLSYEEERHLMGRRGKIGEKEGKGGPKNPMLRLSDPTIRLDFWAMGKEMGQKDAD